jgi:hypothetical protein
MHDYDAHIARWRREALQRLGDAEAVEELEGHLREILATDDRSGGSADECWARACARLGDTTVLAAEYSKVHSSGWADASVYWAVLVLLAFVVSGLIFPMIAKINSDEPQPLLATHVTLLTVGYSLSIVAGLSAWHYALRVTFANRSNRFLLRRLPTTTGWLNIVSLPVTFAGLVLGAVWAAEHRGAAWSWDIREVGGVLVLFAQVMLVYATVQKWSPHFLIGLAGIAASIALLAWFIPVFWQSHSYGLATLILLGALLAFSLSFMLTGAVVMYRPRLQRL